MDRSRLERIVSLMRGGSGTRTGRQQGAATAQDATPVAGGTDGDVAFLFVQSFAAGKLSPKDTAAGVYLLELSDHFGQTIYFSDRPQRLVGTVPTAQFLEGLGFTPANPPNAALVAERPEGDEEVLVVELIDPRYDEATGALTYDVRILADYSRISLSFQQDVHDGAPAEATYGASHLFIDDCPSYPGVCYRPNQAPQDLGCVKFCWDPGFGTCAPCHTITDECCAGQPSGQCDVTYSIDDTCP